MTHTDLTDRKRVRRALHILKLCGVNLSLAALLLAQSGSQPSYQAYLIGRTPGTQQEEHELPDADTDVSVVTTESSTPSDSSTAVYLTFEDDIELAPSSSFEQSSESNSGVSASSSAISRQPIRVPVSSAASEDLRPAAPESTVVPESVQSQEFPAFGNAVSPVARVPNWGDMRTPAEWNRSYKQMQDNDFVQVPAYDLRTLMTPLTELAKTRDDEDTIRMITAKLYYSTRYFGAYNLDAGEFSAIHPGIDLKLADGTPIGSIAGGRVHDVRQDERSLGLHVIIEHRAPDGQTYYSIYGHLDTVTVKKGDNLEAGQYIGNVGMSGNTSGPHLHLQIDRGEPDEEYHAPYWPDHIPSRDEADEFTVNPVSFIRMY